MAPHGLGTYGFEIPMRRNEAPTSDLVRHVDIEATVEEPHIQPGLVAFELVEQVYHWFGMQTTDVPYASLEHREVDPTAF